MSVLDRELLNLSVLEVENFLKQHAENDEVLNSFDIIKRAIVILDNYRLNYNIYAVPFQAPITHESLHCSSPESGISGNILSKDSSLSSQGLESSSFGRVNDSKRCRRGWTIGKSRRAAKIDDDDSRLYEKYMNQLGKNWNLDLLTISNFKNVMENGPIYCMGAVLLRSAGENIHPDFNKLVLPVLRNLQDVYLPNPYHNALHGATVGHMSSILAAAVGANRRFKPYEEFGFIMAALGHDAGHPGKTNSFLSCTGNPLAMIYNDNSILENYHASLMFHVMRHHDSFLKLFPSKDWEKLRRHIIQLVLSTDMKTHFTHVNNVKERRFNGEFDIDKNEEDFWLLMVLCIKTADVGHNFLPWVDHLVWTDALFEEFYLQGDEERLLSMPLLFFFDRNRASDIPDSQLGFFQGFTKPMLDELIFFETSSKYISRVLLANALNNLERWKEASSKKIEQILEGLDSNQEGFAVEDIFVE